MKASNYKGDAPFSLNVLDKGFVALHNLAGPTRRVYSDEDEGVDRKFWNVRPFDADDVDPAQAARMSFGQMNSERTYDQDMKLNEYLLRNMHTSPFEMIQVWIEVKVPIFVDRQFVRHRMWRRNESSGRYITLPADWYIPDTVGGKAPDKKQGQNDKLGKDAQEWFKRALSASCGSDYAIYLNAIEIGVAPEHARMMLHLNHYVHWLGNVDLSNMFKFLSLRTHSHAQVEARVYAWAMVDLLRPHLPGLMALFDQHCHRPE